MVRTRTGILNPARARTYSASTNPDPRQNQQTTNVSSYLIPREMSFVAIDTLIGRNLAETQSHISCSMMSGRWLIFK
jgi:hypothetical protein